MKIVVDTSKLESTAGRIDSYVGSINSHYSTANASVMRLAHQWQGSDSALFLSKWQLTTNQQSAKGKMQQAMKTYAQLLRYASSEYKTAQYNSVKKAHKIDHFFS